MLRKLNHIHSCYLGNIISTRNASSKIQYCKTGMGNRREPSPPREMYTVPSSVKLTSKPPAGIGVKRNARTARPLPPLARLRGVESAPHSDPHGPPDVTHAPWPWPCPTATATIPPDPSPPGGATSHPSCSVLPPLSRFKKTFSCKTLGFHEKLKAF